MSSNGVRATFRSVQAAVVLVMLIGCSGGAGGGGGGAIDATAFDASTSSGGGPHSGTRLQLMVTTADDGLVAIEPDVYYDSLLKVNCTFQHGTDGMLRCLPFAPAANPGQWSDAGCSLPIVGMPTCSAIAAPAYAVVDQNVSCPPSVTVTVYAVDPAPLVTYYGNTGTCVPVSVPPGQTFYATTAIVAPSMFVAGSIGPSP